jgi:hypothetical protein
MLSDLDRARTESMREIAALEVDTFLSDLA